MKARRTKNLILLPSGDGIALVLFGGITAHLECAIEISRDLVGQNDLPVRMGSTVVRCIAALT